jgi:O-acetylhomoserine (thiol)-lyase
MSTIKDRKLGFATRQLHAGYSPDATTGSRAVPLYQTTSYQFKNTEHAANLFALKELGNIYTRLMNPTTDVLEQRIASLEGGVAALAASSGHAAQAQAIFTLCSAGDHIVSSSRLYGGTYNQFAYTLPKLGIEVTFVDPSDPKNFEAAIQPNTKIIYGETLGNPDISVFPFEEVSEIANKHKLILFIDNTFATPYLFRPFEWGAHVITHSTTKFITGNGTSIGGIIVDGGNYDWSNGKFENFNTPDPSYHGLVYSSIAAAGLPPFAIKARVQVLRDLGACQSPFNAWQTLLGLETLNLRIDRHVQNTQAVAEYLEKLIPKSAGSSTLASRATPIMLAPRSIYPRAQAQFSDLVSKAAQKLARSSSKACNSSATSPMSVMRAASLFTPPPPRTASSAMSSKSPLASAPISSA